MKFCDKLDELRAKATPGLWRVNQAWNNHQNCAQIDAKYECIAGAFYLGGTGEARENAELIVYLANHAAEISDALRAAKEVLDANANSSGSFPEVFTCCMNAQANLRAAPAKLEEV